MSSWNKDTFIEHLRENCSREIAKIGESIKDLIDYSGGLRPNASTTIGLKRIVPLNDRKGKQTNTENYYIDYFNSQLTPIQNGDIITVKNIVETL